MTRPPIDWTGVREIHDRRDAESLKAAELNAVEKSAFLAGWWVNAATPEQENVAYFEGCAEIDWLHYLEAKSK